jgi:predicted KAP-like P-loop ATPase
LERNLSSDRPVCKESEDIFNRYKFAKKIAERISNSASNDSIVIGIYGAWGEGKTSVINFIMDALSSCKEVIPIKFNPWRFTDEATLLVSFFNTLAAELVRELPNDVSDSQQKGQKKVRWWLKIKEPLKTKKETIGDIIKKYGRIVSIFGAGETVEVVGKALSDVSVEDLKCRFENLLLTSNRKVAVFIDDIDRLEKSEIHSIFRLVKLTANFLNTYYVLSFDPEMVASAIGERFGDGQKEAGYQFLEKIIQVPLKLPEAQPAALQRLCFQLLSKAIDESKIDFTEEDAKRFGTEFSEHVLVRLHTPREAIRFTNSLSVCFPLLRGEVNYVDLMLIEALKIFYPVHYEFVKKNPIYFTTPYSSNQFVTVNPTFEEKKQDIKQQMENLSGNLNKKEKENVKSLLVSLFPRLEEVFGNIIRNNEENEWFKQKRVVSPNYFNRYFSLSVSEGELSDVRFDELMSQFSEMSVEELAHGFEKLISESTPENFLHKMRSLEEDFDWNKSKIIAKSISLLGSKFPKRLTFFRFDFDSPDKQAAIFIYQLLKSHQDNPECFSLANELMKFAQPFEFAYEINNILRTGKTEKEQIFNLSQYQELAMSLKDRAFQEAGEVPVFEKFPNHTGYIFGTWHEYDKNGFDNYIKDILSNSPEKVMPLLVSFVPLAVSSNHPLPYKTNLTKNQFLFIIGLIDKELIHDAIQQVYSSELIKEKVEFNEFDYNQSDINILRQFEHWYKEN